MAQIQTHKEFNYTGADQIEADIRTLELGLRFSHDIGSLVRPVKLSGGFTLPNSMAIHPMEGCDGEPDGSPGELTVRRYERFARGGAGLIWFEAVAVVPEGKANPLQLRILEENVARFGDLCDAIKRDAASEFGPGFRPLLIMQLTHSGRYSRPHGKPEPIITSHSPYLDAAQKFDDSLPVISDSELERLEDAYVKSALLAKTAGFDGVDVKACHGYLNAELLSSFGRTGKYGGSFEGRTRFLQNITKKIRDRLGKDFIVTTRMNIYDALPYPHGWGMDKTDYLKYDLSEPKRLVRLLHDNGADLINLTMGNPYFNPHVNRPYDKGWYMPAEHPLIGVARLINGIGEIQRSVPDIAVVSTGFSWLRHFAANIGAGAIEAGQATVIGFGRESLAYPDFAADIMRTGRMKSEKCCITCGRCTDIMRAGGPPGCVIRDAKVYAPIYNRFVRR